MYIKSFTLTDTDERRMGMPVFLHKGQNIEYKLVKSSRKTIGIKISPEEGVVISIPLRCSKATVNEVLGSKGDWIISKLKLMEQRSSNMKLREFKAGESLRVLDKEYSFEVAEEDIKGCKASFDGKKFSILVDNNLDEGKQRKLISETLNRLYRDIARKFYSERTSYYAGILKLYPERIAIKEQKSVWGSCSSKNNINYNWKVVMAPLEILDYVVVHELCHLRHRNHSKEYWKLVESILPDYKSQRDWLKENGRLLGLDYIKV